MIAFLVVLAAALAFTFIVRKIYDHSQASGVLFLAAPKRPDIWDAWDERLALTSWAATPGLSDDMRWQLHPAHQPCPRTRGPHTWSTETGTVRLHDGGVARRDRHHTCEACGITISDRSDFWLDTPDQRRYAPRYYQA